MKVLFVCTGNTCRSCMAEAIAREESQKISLKAEFASAGIYAIKGDCASTNAIKVLSHMNIDISCHVSVPLNHSLISENDLIFTMTEGQKKIVVSLFEEYESKIFTIKEFINEEGDIEDPFGGDIYIYRNCALELKESIIKVLEKIKEG